MIRQSEFVTLEVFSEGLCVQCMHIGPFTGRRHHEIYLSDPRKTVAGKMKTILRVPVKKA